MRKLLYSCVCTCLIATPALAEKGEWLVRTRALLVAPTERSGPVLPAFPNSSVSIDNAMTGEVDFTYFITRHIAYEGIVGYPAHHTISGEGDLAFIGEIVGTDALASMGALQFHPFPEAKLRPYLGVGVNWTNFLFEHESGSLITTFGPAKVTIDDSVGILFQAGADIAITKRVFFNADVKYLDIDTTGYARDANGLSTVEVAIDPFVIGVGFGARF